MIALVASWLACAPPALDVELIRALDERRAQMLEVYEKRGVVPPKALSVDAFRPLVGRRLAPGTRVVFYARRGEALAAWVIGPDGVRATHEWPAAGLGPALDAVRGALHVDGRGPARRGVEKKASPGAVATLPDAVAALTALVLPAPLAAALGDAKHLVVVPTGALGVVPFALLEPFGRGEPLALRMSTTVAPSVYDLDPRFHETTAFAGRWEGRAARPLVVGNPAFGADPDWSFAALPFAEAEATAVAGALGGSCLTGGSATRGAVAVAAPGADLLYLATHGVVSSDDPMDGSFLALADGRLTARQVTGLRLTAPLAVLSACQTGLGRALDGGVIGLARAFLVAGVSEVVMSLWSVDDAASAELMTAFMARSKDLPVPEALRQAMLAVREKHPDPSLWAPFAAFGVRLATPGEVRLEANAARYAIGDPLRLTIRNPSREPGFGTLLDRDAAGVVSIVLTDVPLPTARDTLELPELTIAGPPGVDGVRLLVTDAPLRATQLAGFYESPPGIWRSSSTLRIEITPAPAR